MEKETNADGIDTTAVFARHDQHWRTVPDIEFLHIKYFKTTEEVEKGLLDGTLDMALGIGPLTPTQVQKLKFYHSNKVDVRHSDVMQHSLLVMNTNKAGTKDFDTRKAIIHAIDKSEFIEKEFAGLELPVTQLLPFSAPYCNVDLNPKWSYDFEKAQLLNCPLKAKTDEKLPSWGIIVIAVVSVLFVVVMSFALFMYSREKAGKPIFTQLPNAAV